jgi:hypothetical protein
VDLKNEVDLKSLVEKINAALIAGNYKSDEAKASYWSKGDAERIYLNGKKANGYIDLQSGKPTLNKCSFIPVYRIVSAVL